MYKCNMEVNCTVFSLSKTWDTFSIEQDLYVTNHCIPTYGKSLQLTRITLKVLAIENIASISFLSLFIVIHAILIVRKLRIDPSFRMQPGYKMIQIELLSMSFYIIKFGVQLTDNYQWLSPIPECVAWILSLWSASFFSYSVQDIALLSIHP